MDISTILKHCLSRSHDTNQYMTLFEISGKVADVMGVPHTDKLEIQVRSILQERYPSTFAGRALDLSKRRRYYGVFWGMPYKPTPDDVEFWKRYGKG